MKYFTWDLLEQISSMDRNIADSANQQWEQACMNVGKELDKCKVHFSKRLCTLLEHDFFHDAFIENIEIQTGCKGVDLTIFLIQKRGGDSIYYAGKLVHKDVTDFHCSTHFKCFFSERCVGDYLYGEIYKNIDDRITHNFIFGEYGEMNISCKKLIWKPLNIKSVDI